jgi:hypothetical protein
MGSLWAWQLTKPHKYWCSKSINSKELTDPKSMYWGLRNNWKLQNEKLDMYQHANPHKYQCSKALNQSILKNWRIQKVCILQNEKLDMYQHANPHKYRCSKTWNQSIILNWRLQKVGINDWEIVDGSKNEKRISTSRLINLDIDRNAQLRPPGLTLVSHRRK